MSKSKGNVIDPVTKIKASSVDAVRYFLLREGVPHSNSNYSDMKFVNFVNAELGDTLGNLVNRCLAPSLNKSQTFPRFHRDVFDRMSGRDAVELVNMVTSLPSAVDKHYLEFNFFKGIEMIVTTLHKANAFVHKCEPWKLVKDPSQEALLETVLHTTMEALRVSVILLLPITPALAHRILDKLGIHSEERGWQDMKPFECVVSSRRSPYEGRPLGPDRDIVFMKIKMANIQ